MNIITESPTLRLRSDRPPLPWPQMRVLKVLGEALGPLTRGKISDRIGNMTNVVVGRAVGYSDPEKRKAFEQTRDGGGAPGRPNPSLLTNGLVAEIELDIDGLKELCIILTEKGKKFYETHVVGRDFPPLRN